MPHVETVKSRANTETFTRELATTIMAGTTISYLTFPLAGFMKVAQIGSGALRALFSKQRELHGESRNAELYRDLRTSQIGEHKIYRGSTVFAANIVQTTTVQWTTMFYLDKLFPPADSSSSLSAGKAILCGIIGSIPTTIAENCLAEINGVRLENQWGQTRLIRIIASNFNIYTTPRINRV